MKIESFSDALTSVYIKNPCRTLPNALWKTILQINNYYTDFEIENDQVKSLKMWNRDMLYIYWTKDKQSINTDCSQLKTLLVHESQMNDELKYKFPDIEPYFRLLHNNKDIAAAGIPNGYYIRNVDTDAEIKLVSDFICCCYDNIKPDPEEVREWTKHSVFNKELWIWIIDRSTEKPAALGIAESDRNIKEGSLEWIQVLPDYRGRRLGKALVAELLDRLKPYADFTTVSGEIDNKTNPERLYRSCGFYGDDVWYVLRRE